MGRRELQGIIDQVLSMVDEERKRKRDLETARVNQSWDDTPAGQAYWKDKRAKDADLEKQGLVNAGNLAEAKERSAGDLARQELANIGGADQARIQSDAARYTADIGLKGHETTANAQIKAAELGGKTENSFSSIVSKMIENDPSILQDTQKFNAAVTNLRSFFPPDKGASKNFPVTPQSAGQPAAPPVSQPVAPPVPKTSSAQSMTFQTNMGTATNPLREKAEAEDLFYRRNPQLKKKKEEGLFGF